MDNSFIAEFLAQFDDSRFPPSFLSQYEAMECLAYNAQGETLLVRDKKNGAKYIAKCYSDKSLLSSANEGQLLKKLQHSGLPKFIGQYENYDMLCVVRNYVEGVPLNRVAAETPLTKEQIIELGVKLTEILTYLHTREKPVIHRDIKPQNIILCEDGSVKLIDFGISREYEKEARYDTVSFGTQAFAPPEQFGFSQTDCRSDIFSLGMVLGFLVTGDTDICSFEKNIKDTALRRIVLKCTAFSPRERYQNAAAVGRALRAARPGVQLKRGLCIGAGMFAAAALALGGALLLRETGDGKILPAAVQHAAVSFAEPQIEEAVRLQLGKLPGDPITEEELLSVTQLYIFGEKSYFNNFDFYQGADVWYQTEERRLGSITSLEDVARMKNLVQLCVAAQPLSDISPVENLTNLKHLELKADRVVDITALGELKNLNFVGLNGNQVRDLMPLVHCERLRNLDLNGANGYDPKAIALLGDFDFLDVVNCTGSYQYLGGKWITRLKLFNTGMDSLDYIENVKGIQKLEINDLPLRDLSGLVNHRELTFLRLARTPIVDFTPLLELPVLKTVVLSRDQQQRAEAALQGAQFEIQYE